MSPDSPPSFGGLLAINTGSSSVKLALFSDDPRLTDIGRISIERIGAPGTLRITRRHGDRDRSEPVEAADHRTALLDALDHAERSLGFTAGAVGHRIVHGGATHGAPERLTPALLADLRQLTAVDPDHMPAALDAIDAMAQRYPTVPQVACFDTAFHRTMPMVAQRYPLPTWAAAAGVRRYGFHGLSCEFIVGVLAESDAHPAADRLLIAHLGNGASITAVRRGVSVDTTMGFSPTGGLMMGTRSGDLDPTVLTYLARAGNRDVEALHRLVNDEAGLLGVSGLSGDMRDLLEAGGSSQAAIAVELLCYLARKHLAALAAVIDGVDTIVFTGGIGEHAPSVRDRICRGLGHLGVQLEPARNTANDDVISSAESRVVVRVIATDEELVIARHVRDVLA